jgi:ribosomal protein S18 acetylase RimI-like enzyme
MSAIALRAAALSDAAELTDLAFKSFWDAFAGHPKNAPHDLDAYMRSSFNVEQMRRELADEKSIFTIAEIDGEFAGYSKLIIDNVEPGITADRPVELNRLYSHQKFLGKGVGRALMDDCFERARKHGHDVMWLGVWECNPRAQKFYEKHGFRIVGKHVFLLGSDEQTDLLMQREL